MAVVMRKSDGQKFQVFGFCVMGIEAFFEIWDDGWRSVPTEDFEPDDGWRKVSAREDIFCPLCPPGRVT